MSHIYVSNVPGSLVYVRKLALSMIFATNTLGRPAGKCCLVAGDPDADQGLSTLSGHPSAPFLDTHPLEPSHSTTVKLCYTLDCEKRNQTTTVQRERNNTNQLKYLNIFPSQHYPTPNRFKPALGIEHHRLKAAIQFTQYS